MIEKTDDPMVSKLESVSSLLEFLLSKVLREDVCELQIGGDVVQLDLSKLHRFTDVMFRNANVFCSSFLSRV